MDGCPGDSAGQVDLLSTTPEKAAAVCNCIYGLLQQHQVDRDALEVRDEELHKLRVAVQVSANERKRLEDQLNDKHTEIGSLDIKVSVGGRAGGGGGAQGGGHVPPPMQLHPSPHLQSLRSTRLS